jgi:hypothetical protein
VVGGRYGRPQGAVGDRCAALYLPTTSRRPGYEDTAKVFRTFFPRGEVKEVRLWGVKMHEEAAGHEFADKVIAFIDRVIADREKAR